MVITSLLTLILFALGAQLLGRIFNNFTSSGEEGYSAVFFDLLTGLLIVLTGYAIFKTGGKTVFLLGFFFLLFRVWQSRSKLTNPFKQFGLNLHDVLVITTPLVLIWFWQFNVFESSNLQKDQIYYIQIAEELRQLGYENARTWNNFFDPAFRGVETYHYAEMYMAALARDLSGGILNGWESLRLNSYPIFIVGALIGFISLIEDLKTKDAPKTTMYLGALFLFFVPEITELAGESFKISPHGFDSNILMRPNFRTVAMFMIPVLKGFARHDIKLSVQYATVLPVVSVTPVPAVFLSLGVIIIGSRWLLPNGKRPSPGLILPLLITGIFLAVFFSVYKIRAGAGLHNQFGLQAIKEYYSASYKAIIGITAKTFINAVVLIVVPFVAMGFLSGLPLKRTLTQRSSFTVLTLVFFTVSVLLFQGLSFLNNAYQLAYAGFMALVFLYFSRVIVLLDETKTTGRRMIIGILLVSHTLVPAYLFFIQRKNQSLFSPGQLVTDAIPAFVTSAGITDAKTPATFAFLGDSAYYRDLYYAHRMPQVYFNRDLHYLISNAPQHRLICISEEKDILFGLKSGARDRDFLTTVIRESAYGRFRDSVAGKGVATVGSALNRFNADYLYVTAKSSWNDTLEKSFPYIQNTTNGDRLYTLK